MEPIRNLSLYYRVALERLSSATLSFAAPSVGVDKCLTPVMPMASSGAPMLRPPDQFPDPHHHHQREKEEEEEDDDDDNNSCVSTASSSSALEPERTALMAAKVDVQSFQSSSASPPPSTSVTSPMSISRGCSFSIDRILGGRTSAATATKVTSEAESGEDSVRQCQCDSVSGRCGSSKTFVASADRYRCRSSEWMNEEDSTACGDNNGAFDVGRSLWFSRLFPQQQQQQQQQTNTSNFYGEQHVRGDLLIDLV